MLHFSTLLLSLLGAASHQVAALSNCPQDSAPNVTACRLPARNNVDLSMGFGYKLNCAPSTGTLNAFLFFVDFPDATAPQSETPQSLYGQFFPAATEWYANSSYGRLALNVTADNTRFHRMPARADSYGWQRGLTAAAHQKYIQDALEAYGAAIPFVDVLYVIPTTRASAISFSPTYMGDVRTRAGVAVARKSVTLGLDAYRTWKSKVINHETGHTMCLPDLYPLPSGATGLYVGGWDMMGYINGPSPDYFAWSKWRLGWLDDTNVACVSSSGSSVHTIAPLEPAPRAGDIKAVVVRHNGTAALVAEVRSKNGVDAAACGTGVLLYTVSTATETGKGPIRVLDANPGSGGCAGDELNDAPLSLSGTTSFTVPGWGVKVTVTDKVGESYTIRVDVA